MTVYDGRIQLFALTAAEWAAANPVLMLGEIGAQDVGSSTPVLKIGDGVRPYAALPNLLAPVVAANDYVAGPVTTLPPGASATVIIDNTVDPPSISFGIPQGATGPANSLTIGTVTASAPGAPAGATITGTPPNQVLSLVIPRGDPGPQGPQGPQGIPGTAALANPSAQVGLVPVNGASAFAMRADAAPALSQAIVPTWTGAHTFSNVLTTFYGANAASDGVQARIGNGNGPANSRLWALRVNEGGNFRIDALNDAGAGVYTPLVLNRAGASNYVDVMALNSVTQIQLNTATLTSAAAGDWSGAHTFSAQAAINLTHASGYIAWKTGATFDASIQRNATALHISTGINIPMIFYTNNTNRGQFTAAGNLWLEKNLNVGGGTVTLSQSARDALTDLGDGYLRINHSTHYANGIYTPAKFRASGMIQSDVGFGNAAADGWFKWGPPPPSATFGTCHLTGAINGFHAFALYDGGLNPAFMSNNAVCGIIVQGDSKWLIYRTGTTTAETQYNFTAPSFNVPSSRKLKRETGRITGAAAILARLRHVLYRLLAGDTREQMGLIAEEVKEICPWLSDGKTVSYDRLALLLLADWQEQHSGAAP